MSKNRESVRRLSIRLTCLTFCTVEAVGQESAKLFHILQILPYFQISFTSAKNLADFLVRAAFKWASISSGNIQHLPM